MRIPFIAGNWKMFKTVHEAVVFVKELQRLVKDQTNVEIVVAPPFTAVHAVAEALRHGNVGVGGQDLYWEPEGAFTGEVSARMLKEAGAEYAIIGHSERRQFYGETDESVNKKTKSALQSNLTAIVCVGEMLDERESGNAESVVKTQLKGSLDGLTVSDMKRIIIAYEPVWAIGTGKTATPEQAQEMHGFIRNVLIETHGKETADEIRILYGGSVKPENIADLMNQTDIDGALVGGASLQADSFAKIVNYK